MNLNLNELTLCSLKKSQIMILSPKNQTMFIHNFIRTLGYELKQVLIDKNLESSIEISGVDFCDFENIKTCELSPDSKLLVFHLNSLNEFTIDCIFNGRFRNLQILFICNPNDCIQLEPSIRFQFDYFFLQNEVNSEILNELFETYAGFIPNFQTFYELMNKFGQNGNYLVFNYVNKKDPIRFFCLDRKSDQI